MLDFNHTLTFSEQLQGMVDAGMVAHRATQKRREYLGASRLGVACERALQYEFDHIPRDQGKEPDGRLLRIFERGTSLRMPWRAGCALEVLICVHMMQTVISLASASPKGSCKGISTEFSWVGQRTSPTRPSGSQNA